MTRLEQITKLFDAYSFGYHHMASEIIKLVKKWEDSDAIIYQSQQDVFEKMQSEIDRLKEEINSLNNKPYHEEL